MQRRSRLATGVLLVAVGAVAIAAAAGAHTTTKAAGAAKGLWGSSYSGKPKGAPIKLGIVTDPGGRAGGLGPTAIQAWKLMVKMANANGGIMGHPVEFIIRDEQLTPSVAAQQLRSLILSDRINAAFGTLLSSSLIAESKINGSYKMPLISAMAGDDRVVNNAYQGSWNPYMGMIGVTTHAEACAFAKWAAANLPYTKYAVLKENYDYGIDNAREFETCIKQYKPGTQIVKETAANLGTKDFTPFINTMLAAKPQFIYTNVFGGDAVTFYKQYQQLGVKTPTATLWDLTVLQTLGKNFPTNAPVYAYMRGAFFAAPTKYVTPFVNQFKAAYHNWPSDWALMAEEAFIAYKQAVETAGTYTDTDKVMDAFYNQTFTGPFGPVKVRCLDGWADVPVWVGQLKLNPKYGFATLVPGRSQIIKTSAVWPSDSQLKIPDNGRCKK